VVPRPWWTGGLHLFKGGELLLDGGDLCRLHAGVIQDRQSAPVERLSLGAVAELGIKLGDEHQRAGNGEAVAPVLLGCRTQQAPCGVERLRGLPGMAQLGDLLGECRLFCGTAAGQRW
jgi:hypothetical protein